MEVNFKTILKAVGTGLVLIILISGIFYSGFVVGNQGTSDPGIITGIINPDTDKPSEVDFGVFWETWRLIEQTYVRADEIDNETLLHGAISGLVDSLGDPHSLYFSPDAARRFSEDISGEFSGVGMEIAIREKKLTVVSPLKGTPADSAGIKAGDVILKVDDEFTTDINIDEAVELIRGPKGSEVTLLVSRESWDEPRDIVVRRDVITIPALEHEMLEGNIAHLKLFNFNDNVPVEFYKAAVDILWQDPEGMILDLRNNPGGYLEVAVSTAGWFLDKGDVITKEEFRDGKSNVFRSSGNSALSNVPVVILVNEGSASAAEILAGALRDHKDAPLVGAQTFGKGSVQEVRQLSDGSSVKITVAQWLTPNGSHIDSEGLEPDHAVEFTAENIEAGDDPQLEKALEVLRSLIAQ